MEWTISTWRFSAGWCSLPYGDWFNLHVEIPGVDGSFRFSRYMQLASNECLTFL